MCSQGSWTNSCSIGWDTAARTRRSSRNEAVTEEFRPGTGMALRKAGPVKITPLAADSLGARSTATLVETPDVTVLLDPSVRLGPYRFDLRPHATVQDRQEELWQRIRRAPKRANVLTGPHYHDDHHHPDAPSI